MANFLITSPNSLTEGTTSNDLIVVQSGGLLGATVYANDGNDLITAGAGNGVNTILNGQQGDDTITLAPAGVMTLGKAVGGGGNDIIAFGDGVNASITTIHGGGGADTLNFGSGFVASSTTVNGNGGKDLIQFTAGTATFNNSWLAMGGGADTLNASAVLVFSTASTIAAGGGDDFISALAVSGVSQFRVEGDTVGDTEFFGNDTIRLGGDLGTTALVQGGGGTDVLQISATIGTGSTINGNAGKDSIVISGIAASSDLLVGGGAGADTIAISAALTTGFGTIFGGGGADVINVSAAATGAGGTIIGGEGADSIGLGAIVSGGTTNLRYTAFSESTLGTNDVISANGAASGDFVISQTVVSASAGINLNVGGVNGFNTNAQGIVSGFGANVGNDVTARATVLDQFLSEGQTVGFSDGNGNDYIFIQGGAAGSGTEGDFLAQLNTGATTLAAAGGTAITVTIA